MIVKYSPDIFEEKPSRKPCGFVVVNPTRIFSAIVERQLPKKSYFTEELDRKFTPISILWQQKCKMFITMKIIVVCDKLKKIISKKNTHHPHKLVLWMHSNGNRKYSHHNVHGRFHYSGMGLNHIGRYSQLKHRTIHDGRTISDRLTGHSIATHECNQQNHLDNQSLHR